MKEAPKLTSGQENALAAAENYLSIAPFYGGDFTRTVRAHLSSSAPRPPAPHAGTPTADGRTLIVQLRELGALRDEGVLTEEEFATQKARLLET